MVAGVPPIGTQVSALAQADPDAPAVTCEGRTVTRAELDASTNRLARAYAQLGADCAAMGAQVPHLDIRGN